MDLNNFNFTDLLKNTSQSIPIKDTKSSTETVIKESVTKKEKILKKETVEKYDLTDEEKKSKMDLIIDKLNTIESELNNVYIERENEIRMLLLALTSASNAFLYGPAGTGKSQLTEDISNRITNSNYFRILVGKTTEPAELFGPVSINSMKKDMYKVNTDGKLPRASIAFLDEVFKGNSAILNGLLTIMNEKLFFNDVIEEVPLISLIGASNEFIEEDNLLALYDRFLLRWNVQYIQEIGNRMNLFKIYLDNRKKSSKVYSNEIAATNEITTIDLSDLKFINEICKEVDIPLKILKSYNILFLNLEKKGIMVSDRRKNEALKVLQSSAILNKRNAVTIEDFDCLKYILWSDLKEVETVMNEINAVSNPNKLKYDGYLKTFKEFKSEYEKLLADSADPMADVTLNVKRLEINKQLNVMLNNIIELELTLNDKEKALFSSLKTDIKEFLKVVKSDDEFYTF